ncbi:MAG: hypothetical protein ABIF10_03805 [Candidatus Woesearchaeota archaeon]
MGRDNQLNIDKYTDKPTLFTIDKLQRNGNWYSNKVPGLPFIGSSLIKTMTLVTGDPLDTDWQFFLVLMIITVAISGVATAACAILIHRVTCRLTQSNKLGVIAAFSYGLGTSAFLYATRYRSHAIAAFLCFFCFYVVYRLHAKEKTPLAFLFISGFAGGLAIITDLTTTVIIFGVLFIFMTVTNSGNYRKIACFLCGILLPLICYGVHNLYLFNSPISISYFVEQSQPWPSVSVPIGPVYSVGISLWKFLAHYDLTTIPVIKEAPLTIARNIIQILFLPFRGLFVYSPILLLSLLGTIALFRVDKKIATFTVFIWCAILIFVAGSYDWWCHGGGFCRRFVPFVPFLFLPIALALKNMSRKIVITLMAVSIFTSLLTINPYEGLGGYPYGIRETTYRYTIVQFYDTIASPLTGHYLPLFVKFGPQSGLLERISSKTFLPFLNLLAASIILGAIWWHTVHQYIKEHPKISVILLVSMIIFVSARMHLSEQLFSYSQKEYSDYYTDRPVEPALRRSEYMQMIFPNYYYGKWANKIRFNIPYILLSHDSIVSINEQNKNWYVPAPNFVENYTEVSMKNNATITVKLNEEINMTYLLCLQARSYSKERSLQIFQENRLLSQKSISKTKETFSVQVTLAPGENHLKFVSLEGCDLQRTSDGQLMRELRCISFVFTKMEFIDTGNTSENDLYCTV